MYMIMAIYANYFSIYFKHLGMTPVEIGVLNAIGPVVTIFVPVFFGSIADRSKYKNTILSVVIAMSAAISFLFFFGRSFIYIFFVVMLFFSAFCSISPLSDAIALERSALDGFNYSHVRLAGTLGFAVIALVVGYLSDFDLMYSFYALSLCCTVSFVFSLFLPKVRGHAHEVQKVSIFELYKDKKYLAYQIFAALFWGNVSISNAFFGLYLTDGLGGTKAMLGYANITSILIETVLLATGMRITKKLGTTKTLCATMAIVGIRMVLTAASAGPWMLIGVNILHGMTVMVFMYMLATYVNENMRPELKARGQMMNTVISMGFARMVGSLVSGFMVEGLGYKMSFCLSGVFCLACALVFYLFLTSMDRREKRLSDQI